MKEEAGTRAGAKGAGPAGGRPAGVRSAAASHRNPAQPMVGDRLKLRKKHPCGGTEFEVVRTGMDIRLQCLTCGSQIVLSRRKLEKMTAERNTQGTGR